MIENTAQLTGLVARRAETSEVPEMPRTSVPRLGRGIRWSDLVAEMHQELVDRELEDREAAA
ncbi:hypothetical protein SAMN05216266_10731 [Amycolatopsis marina]|uniref:Uncharacterized protein n=1 Tax=Amycolatopsis marina TaxID=490629 RepID=A0A1I0ZIK4_9PSEU|nr:DUF6222 family protein [Amycolatopsis marina]SFB25485.1 hypothetical protein SAMN05216266_10731 [Amycolatopsis marina]